ncbi:hypothetical protein [Saccharopolyspora hattusasensis]|uniref:hypothetical protein n=1 Tax=Saccharopolyspora hattusasensis TaxID=1128679 RepID=UPI003D99CB55
MGMPHSVPDPGGRTNKGLPSRARSARQAQRALRQQRRDSSDHGRRRRLARRIGELFGEFLAEALLASVALALFAGVLAAGAWGWQHSPAATVVLVAGIALFLAFGAHQLATRRAGQRKRGRLAAAAVGTVIFVLIWAMYLVLYLPSP